MKIIISLIITAFLPIIGIADLSFPTPPLIDPIPLHQGESYTFSFKPTDFSFNRDYDTTSDLPINVEWSFGAYQHSQETIYDISLYSDSPDLIPTKIITVTNSMTAISGRLFLFQKNPNTGEPIEIWDDMEGSIKFEVKQGSFQLTQADASTIIDGQIYTAAIPEPSSVALLIIGGGAMYMRRKRFPTRSWTLLGQRPFLMAKSVSQAGQD
ncbi:PEP-CTERM sorting domain-containing protein [Verrucomicrobia bacterium S94]|nr:PEP-CTERM sorting domain-containing protein [Verrucomicrobia bacterium S94]